MNSAPFFGQTIDGRIPRAAIYARVSTDDQEADNQLLELREFIGRQGWTPAGEFVDVASGGRDRNGRPQLDAMLGLAARRKVDVVVTWALDRLTREGAAAALGYLQQLAGWGVAYRSLTEPHLDTSGPFQDVIVALLATLARQEKVRIGERTRAGLVRARAAGKTLGRPKVGDDARRDRARELRANGRSLRQIAVELGVGRGTVAQWTATLSLQPCP